MKSLADAHDVGASYIGPGSRIARYVLDEQVGSGPMGAVFRAHDELLDRVVALKIVRPELAADAAFRQRFVRESRAAATVDHPNIIPIYEVNEVGGVLFIAMRFVRGGDVRALAGESGVVAPGRVAAIISQVASALDAVHAVGLVHGRVEPANVLVDAPGSAGRRDHVYLSDLGLGRVPEPAGSATAEGLLTSADYIAPEQLEGFPADSRSDVYSLACTAFALLTGAPPFQGPTIMAVLEAKVSGRFTALTGLRPDLPAAAERVFATALAKRPAGRYTSCGEFAAALRTALGVPPGLEVTASAGAAQGPVGAMLKEGDDRPTAATFRPPGLGSRPRESVTFPVNPADAAAARREDTGAFLPPVPFQAAVPLREPAGASPPTVPGASSPGDVAEPREPEPAPRFLVGHLPTSVALGSEVSLTVRIAAAEPTSVASQSVALPGLRVGRDGSVVTIVVQAPREMVPLGPLEHTFKVPVSGDSVPVRFWFRALGAGLHNVLVTAWAGGTFLGELSLEISVHHGGRFIDAPARRAPVGAICPQPGEVTLQVRFDGSRYSFQLLSANALFEPALIEMQAAQPGVAVERTIDTLRKMASGSSGYTGPNARRWMAEVGVGLWNEMVPNVVKEQFWQLRDEIGSLSIASSRDVVPWELLYPLEPGRDEGFLVEQFPVLRRVYGQQSGVIALSGARYIVPVDSPGNALDEITMLKGILAQTLTGADDIADLGALLDLIDSGNIGLLHFACHNTFRADVGGSAIAMGGGPFVPAMLSRAVTLRALAKRRPLVFINACRSAGAVPEYTEMTGWAQQFMAAGAGAFVGTLWAVRSDSARAFAAAFYSRLAAGATLGEAARSARADANREADDPTWLAYTVYGDPAAHATAN